MRIQKLKILKFGLIPLTMFFSLESLALEKCNGFNSFVDKALFFKVAAQRVRNVESHIQIADSTEIEKSYHNASVLELTTFSFAIRSKSMEQIGDALIFNIELESEILRYLHLRSLDGGSWDSFIYSEVFSSDQKCSFIFVPNSKNKIVIDMISESKFEIKHYFKSDGKEFEKRNHFIFTE